MVRLIFLDVDGVLALWRSQVAEGNATAHELEKEGLLCLGASADAAPPLERACLEHLSYVVREAGASVILSSTWREDPVLVGFLKAQLEKVGVAVDGVTPIHRNSGRGQEVLEYLDDGRQDVESFVIIDDEWMDSFESCGLGDRVVQTLMMSDDYLPGDGPIQRFDPAAGLTREKAEACLAVLRKPR